MEEPATRKRLSRVISGGQTGVDRAALDAALARGIAIGGWCPHGRRAEDGYIPARFPLVETPSPKYPQRTVWNVRDGDATLILVLGAEDGGTQLARRIAERMKKPHVVVDLDAPTALQQVFAFLHDVNAARLNVAGPRESMHPGIYARAYAFLLRVFGGWSADEAVAAQARPRVPLYAASAYRKPPQGRRLHR